MSLNNEYRPTVCHLTTRLIKGGADFNIYYNLLHSAERFDFTLVVGPHCDEELLDSLRDAGVRVVVIPSIRRSINPFREIAAFYALRRLFQEHDFDIVYTHNAKTGILGRFAVHRGPVVIHGVHGMSFTETMRRPAFLLFRWLERRAATRTDWFVSVGEKIRDLMLDAGVGRPEQYRIIRSGMAIERFLGARRDTALRRDLGCAGSSGSGESSDSGESPTCVLFAILARLERRKGQHWFLEAFAAAVHESRTTREVPPARGDADRSEVPPAHGYIDTSTVPAIHDDNDTRRHSPARRKPDLRAVLLGDGPERDALQAQARRLGIADRVRFTGFRSNPEDYLAAADVVCLTSEWEGVPQSLIQAAAVGRPAVAFDVPGIREVLYPDRTGLIVPYGDVPALTAALLKIAGDPVMRERFGKAAVERDLSEWRLETMVERTEALYREVVGHSDASPS